MATLLRNLNVAANTSTVISASHALNSNNSVSALNSLTASYTTTAITASYAVSAETATTALTASYIIGGGGAGGTSGTSGVSGAAGTSGTSGVSGASGAAGTDGSSGTSGVSGTAGTSGASGAAGADGSSGTSGASGAAGSSGTSGASGAAGSSGTSGSAGTSGTTGASGSSGTSGSAGTSGSSGANGSSGTSGTAGSSGNSVSVTTSDTAPIDPYTGSLWWDTTTGDLKVYYFNVTGSWVAASSAVSGTAGTSGSSGTSGTTGTSGSSGTAGSAGTAGSSGTSGASFVTGSTYNVTSSWANSASYFSGVSNGTTNYVAKFTGANTIGTGSIFDNGSVGIGTTSPFAKLDVEGRVNIGTGTSQNTFIASSPQLQLFTDGGTANSLGIWQAGIASGEFGVKASDSNLYITNTYSQALGTAAYSITLTNAGNVGIGTSSPAAKLHISGTNAGIIFDRVTADVDPSGIQGSIYVKENGISNYEAMLFRATGYRWQSDDGTDRMLINSSGNVGIGTSSPTYKLDVYDTTGALTRLKSNAGGDQVLINNAASNPDYSANVVIQSDNSGSAGHDLFRAQVTNYAGTKFVIRSGGNVGIGTTSPAYKLVVNDANDVRIQLDSSTTQGFYFTKSGANNGTYRVDTNGNFEWYTKSVSQAMSLTAGGNLLVGTTSALNGSIGLSVQGAQGGAGQAVATIYNSDASDTAPALSLSKASGTTSSSARFIQFYASGFGTAMGGIVGNGSGNVQFAAISDAREKTNIQSITGSLNKVLALKPVSFDWISNNEHTPAGFIAQDVKEVFPEFVVENMANEGSEQRYGLTGGLNNGVTAHLVKAIQELKADNDSLRARITALESK